MTDTRQATEHSTRLPDKELTIDERVDGLTDDERVCRENPKKQTGARVQPGPADREREPNV